MPCWRPAQLVQHTTAVEEEPAVHPEPIDNPGCEKMGKLGEVNTSQEKTRKLGKLTPLEKSGIKLTESSRMEQKRHNLEKQQVGDPTGLLPQKLPGHTEKLGSKRD